MNLPLCALAALLGMPNLRPSAYFWNREAFPASVARLLVLRGLLEGVPPGHAELLLRPLRPSRPRVHCSHCRFAVVAAEASV